MGEGTSFVSGGVTTVGGCFGVTVVGAVGGFVPVVIAGGGLMLLLLFLDCLDEWCSRFG